MLLTLVVAVAFALLVGCYTTTFTPASQPRQYTGDGGTAHQAAGVEIWTSGAPERPFEIIGWLEDKRHTGLISRQTFDPDVAEAAKKAGGDGVIVQHSDTQFRGYVVGSNYATAVNDRTTRLAVFKYIKNPAVRREALKPRPVPMKNGFRDLAWGDPVPADFVFRQDLPPAKTFTRPGDSLKLGPLEATRIEYAFIDGARLAEVVLVFRRETEPALLAFLVQTWGAPDSIDKDGRHTWGRPEEPTLAELTVTANETVLEIESRALVEEAIRAMKEKAAKDAGL